MKFYGYEPVGGGCNKGHHYLLLGWPDDGGQPYAAAEGPLVIDCPAEGCDQKLGYLLDEPRVEIERDDYAPPALIAGDFTPGGRPS